MGLDSYLSAEKYISGYDFDKDENFQKVLDLLNLSKEDVEKSAGISITIGYWRKANAIHNWFVKNVQNGEDKCQRSYVSKEKLESLKTNCLEALVAYNAGNKDNAKNIITPTGGFFFGNTDIDDGYKSDLEHTIEVINKVLDKFKNYDIYYQASW